MIAHRSAALLGSLMALAACASSPPAAVIEGNPQDTCQAQPGQRFIGMVASQALGSQLLAATSAREIRWVPPGTVVTMDYKFGRLTVAYDDEMRISSVVCS